MFIAYFLLTFSILSYVQHSLAYVLESKFFKWKNGYDIHYVQNGSSGPPLLLLPGFGVGTFHYNRNYEELSRHFQVFSIDLLGQGKSWPTEVTEDHKLCYSIETWKDQISYFIENVIGCPVHIAGNSLGGLLCAAVGSDRPELVKSVCFLNAAPFWAFLPPVQDKAQAAFPWNGKMVDLSVHFHCLQSLLTLKSGILPAPKYLLDFGSTYFDTLRKPQTVSTMLKTVYKNPTALEDSLVANIINSANNPSERASCIFCYHKSP